MIIYNFFILENKTKLSDIQAVFNKPPGFAQRSVSWLQQYYDAVPTK